MKRSLFIFGCMLLIIGCKKNMLTAPKNCIDRDKMISILYDISVLESLKSTEVVSLEKKKINPATYIFQKYKIDSLTFAQSNKYYASDVEDYANMYQTVIKKIEAEKAVSDTVVARKNRSIAKKAKKQAAVEQAKYLQGKKQANAVHQ